MGKGSERDDDVISNINSFTTCSCPAAGLEKPKVEEDIRVTAPLASSHV